MKPNVLFAGAYRFGNVGDDAYRKVFTDEALGASVAFDSPFPSDVLIRMADAIVIGGGGLLYCNDTAHFEYMRRYMEGALDHGKPLLFASVGVQLVPPTPKDMNEAIGRAGELAPWAKYLEHAASITVRSMTDQLVLKELCPSVPAPWAFDACYGLRGVSGPRELAVMIPTRQAVQDDVRSWEAFRRDALEQGLHPMILAFGREDVVVAEQLANRLRMRLGGNRVWLHPTVDDALTVLDHASAVMTGRYHGKVLAIARGVPRVTVLDRRYKALADDACVGASALQCGLRVPEIHVYTVRQTLRERGLIE